MAPSLRMPAETRRQLNEHDRRWPFNLGMRAAATLFAFIAMILFATCTNLSKQHYGGNDWVDAMPLAPVCSKSLKILVASLFHGRLCAS